MMLTQKCQYAMRAVFELAKREGRGPVKINEIAEAQAIPQRFLENILNQLRQGGVVESRRGKEGGWPARRARSRPEPSSVWSRATFIWWNAPRPPLIIDVPSTGIACSCPSGNARARPSKPFMMTRPLRIWSVRSEIGLSDSPRLTVFNPNLGFFLEHHVDYVGSSRAAA